MNAKQKALLESKLMVYKACYQQAESKKDKKRMDEIEVIIDDLSEQVANFK